MFNPPKEPFKTGIYPINTHYIRYNIIYGLILPHPKGFPTVFSYDILNTPFFLGWSSNHAPFAPSEDDPWQGPSRGRHGCHRPLQSSGGRIPRELFKGTHGVLGGWSFFTKPFKGTTFSNRNKKRWDDYFFRYDSCVTRWLEIAPFTGKNIGTFIFL